MILTHHPEKNQFTIMPNDIHQVGAFSHKEMVEPIAVAVSPRGEFVVVDNGVGILVFDQCGKLIRNCHKSQSNDGKNLL